MFKLLYQFLCFHKSEMIEKAKIIKIKAAGFSPVLVVHDSNRIFSLLQQDNVAWHPALLWSEFAKTKIGLRFFFFFFFFFFGRLTFERFCSCPFNTWMLLKALIRRWHADFQSMLHFALLSMILEFSPALMRWETLSKKD